MPPPLRQPDTGSSGRQAGGRHCRRKRDDCILTQIQPPSEARDLRYTCKAYWRILEHARNAADRRALAREFDGFNVDDDRVYPTASSQILFGQNGPGATAGGSSSPTARRRVEDNERFAGGGGPGSCIVPQFREFSFQRRDLRLFGR